MQGRVDWRQNTGTNRSGAGGRKLWRTLMILSGCVGAALGLICTEIGWGNLVAEVPVLLRVVVIDGAVFVLSLACFLMVGSGRRREERRRGRELGSIPFDPHSEWDRWIASLYTENQQKAKKQYRTAAVLLAVCVALGVYLAAILSVAEGNAAALDGSVNAMVPGVLLILGIVTACMFSGARKKSRVSDGRQVTAGEYRDRLVIPCMYEEFGEARFLPDGPFHGGALLRASGVLGELDFCSAYGLYAVRYKGVPIAGADLCAGYEYTVTSEDKEGRRTTETRTKTVFEGRWLELQSQRPLTGGMFCVWSRQFAKNRGPKHCAAQGMLPVRTGNDRFDGLFDVYAHAQDGPDALRFLTPVAMAGLERLVLTETGKRTAHGVALVVAGNLVQALVSDLPAAFVPDRVVRNLTEAACREKIRGEIAVVTDVADSLYGNLA